MDSVFKGGFTFKGILHILRFFNAKKITRFLEEIKVLIVIDNSPIISISIEIIGQVLNSFEMDLQYVI